MGWTFTIRVSLAAAMLLGILLAFAVGAQYGMLALLVVGMPFAVTSRALWDEYANRRALTPLARFRLRLCTACAYDLRSTPARCPECGHLTERPNDPLPRPRRRGGGDQNYVRQVNLLLQMREPTPAGAWGESARARMAAELAYACSIGAGWANDSFRPDDPFDAVIDNCEGMGWSSIVLTMRSMARLELGKQDFDRFVEMRFGDVVDDLLDRVRQRARGTVRPE
jgi:hypothetical protein